MTIEKLRRVLWRIRSRCPNMNKVLNSTLRWAIMHEIGTDYKTYYNNRKALIKLGWIRTYKTKKVILTNKDITS